MQKPIERGYRVKVSIPRATKEEKDLFTSLVPKDSRVSTRLMFGNDAAFVNGNLFFGIYGKDLFVRLREDEAKELLKEKGSRPFEPMPGRPMRGYVVVPIAWKADLQQIRKWVGVALASTSTISPKKPKR
jgi:TfoX/Sxy family transcriptional regulator of competence genes